MGNPFMFSLNAILPLVLMVAAGYMLKRTGVITRDFVKMANKLVFRFFIPIMLFLNIYKIESIGDVRLGFVVYTVVVMMSIFFVSIPIVKLLTPSAGARGVLLQSTFRSNFALIGVPIANALFPGEGAAIAAILSAFIIPIFNVLAVVSLTVFEKQEGTSSRIKSSLLSIAKNPLIISVVSGLLVLGVRAAFTSLDISFRLSSITPVYEAATSIAAVATPLSLIVLGAQFEFSTVKSKTREIVFGTIVRIVVSPILGLGLAVILFRDVFSGAQFAAMSAAFLTPVAVSSVPMAQEMGADAELAGQLVVWTTLFSSVTVFLSVYALSYIGIFGALG